MTFEQARAKASALRDLQTQQDEHGFGMPVLPAGCMGQAEVDDDVRQANSEYMSRHGARRDDAEAQQVLDHHNMRTMQDQGPVDDPAAVPHVVDDAEENAAGDDDVSDEAEDADES